MSPKLKAELRAEQLDHEAGKAVGRRWVQHEKTDIREVQRLDGVFPEWDYDFFGRTVSASTTAERVFFLICPKDDGDRKAARWFWESVLREAPPRTAWLRVSSRGLWKSLPR